MMSRTMWWEQGVSGGGYDVVEPATARVPESVEVGGVAAGKESTGVAADIAARMVCIDAVGSV
jgi:hypothetical protein